MSKIKLHLGDCRDLLPAMSRDSVRATITDPLYGVGVADWDGSVPYDLVDAFLAIASGTVVWFGSAPNVCMDAKRFPVEPDRMMIWAPKFTLSKIAKDGYAYRFHPIWFWRVCKQKVMPWDFFDDMTEGGNWWKHPATKPKSLMRKLVLATTDPGDTVFDPFMGSGTTGVVCVATDRNFVGVEIDERYYKIAEQRIEFAKMQMSKRKVMA